MSSQVRIYAREVVVLENELTLNMWGKRIWIVAYDSMQNGQMRCPQGRESARYDAPSYLQQAKDTTTLGWDNVSTYVLAIKKNP